MFNQIIAFLENAKSSIVLSWLLMLLVAAALALMASGRPKRPFRRWLGDYFVKWGLAGLLLWLVVFGLWAVREVLAQNYVFLIGPLEGFLENATIWGVVLTGFLTTVFFGGTLLLQAIFAKPEIELPEGTIYIRREVLMVPERGKTISAKETYLSVPVEAPELKEEQVAGQRAGGQQRIKETEEELPPVDIRED
ncbi:MAG: hypothetical protein TU35_008400 [Thermoproteus sp. AZ2]|uniref:Uncharacterized protein n=1 Tax=Thermoproteus sp. AZ2 TaxID=1609232 RepID=A0ACC6V2K6_9CREN